MLQLPIKLPTTFEEALGYPYKDKDKARWVAFYWEPCGDECEYNDGLRSGTGNPWGFLAFVRHHKVSPWLAGYDLGSSDEPAKHWLLCDLKDRAVFVGGKAEVSSNLAVIVRDSTPSTVLTDFSPEEFKQALEDVIKTFKEIPPPSMKEVQEAMVREQESIEKMNNGLEATI
jgi:hypothetical protein